ncbi:MFS transporter [Novosphingobium sp. Leaf2]|uniref:MFS transporter n=1 Tax=Novosphingobium sp. Leaf2 TaxID=1735670 RepID=UPI000AF8A858|nr:MFS transporter [Novosphingobium sp. Leaf2]
MSEAAEGAPTSSQDSYEAQRPVGATHAPEAIVVAAAGAICMGFSFAPVFMGTFPLFLQPVSQTYHWSAAIFPQAMLIAGLVSALGGPLIGRAIDKAGVRTLLLPGLVVWAMTLAALPFIGGSVVLLYLVSAIMGVTTVTCGPVALAKIITGWFDRRRGLAMSIVLGGGVAIFTAMMLGLTRVLISAIGWQNAYLALAALVILVALPVSYAFLKEAPHGRDAAMDGLPPPSASIEPLVAFSSRTFWALVAGSSLVCASCSAIASHFLPLSAEHGISSGTAVFALSLYSLAGPIGSLIAGAAADRLPNPRFLAIIFAAPLAGFLLMQITGAWAIVAGLALVGAGFSAVASLLPFLTSRYFGLANASTIFAVAMGIVTLFLGVGPVVLGLVRDRWGAYAPASPIIVAVLIIGAILPAILPRYPRH